MSRLFVNILVISLLFVGCFKSQQGAHKLINSANVGTEQKSAPVQPPILDFLKTINKQYLPALVKDYFEQKNNIQINVLDNYTVKFYQKKGTTADMVQVKLLLTTSNKAVLFINGIRKDSLFYQSYFYSLLKQNNQYPNVTLMIMPEQVIQIFKIELNTQLLYRRLGNFWAYMTDSSSYAMDFDFHGENAYVSRCFLTMGGKPEMCNVIVRLIWTGNKFIFRLVSSRPASKGLLSEDELERVRRYTSLDQAFIDPEDVYILDLQGENIDHIPTSFTAFTHLQILILSDNNLDSLPDELGQLQNLQVLRADNNNISYISPAIGNLRNLTELSLSGNKISWVPYEFARLESLEKLDLSQNQLQVLAFDMADLQHMYSLEIAGNKFSSVPSQIFKLKKLLYLDISNNPIKVIPREFIFMPSLQYLVITGTKIDSSQVNYLKIKRPNLQVIY